MLGSYEAAMVDAAAESAGLPLGCRTLCQYPGCGQPIEERTAVDGRPMWMHIGWGNDGAEDRITDPHWPTPVEQPEPSPGERLVASVQRSYEAHRQARRVRPLHIELMADRLAVAAQDRLVEIHGGKDSEGYQRAVRVHWWRRLALRRLAEALERQSGGGLR